MSPILSEVDASCFPTLPCRPCLTHHRAYRSRRSRQTTSVCLRCSARRLRLMRVVEQGLCASSTPSFSQSSTAKSSIKISCSQMPKTSANLVRPAAAYHGSLAAQLIAHHAVYYNDIPVGTICCRLETTDGSTKLYLMTMGVLAVCHQTLVSANEPSDNQTALSLAGTWLSEPAADHHRRQCPPETEDRLHIPSRPSLQ